VAGIEWSWVDCERRAYGACHIVTGCPLLVTLSGRSDHYRPTMHLPLRGENHPQSGSGVRVTAMSVVAAMAWALAAHADPGIAGIACPPAAGKRVLFIGNSLTYANDMPGIVTALAAAVHEPVRVVTIAFPDFSLQDHWNQGAAREAIAGGCWDVVILQQGPSALEESRAILVEYVRRFSTLARAAGATPAVYMVWPARDRLIDFRRSSESYRIAADTAHDVLMPVGDAWEAAWRRDSSLVLYAPDGLHPSAAGSYLAALVITARLAGRAPGEMPAALMLPSGASLSIPAATAAVLQQAAAEADADADAAADLSVPTGKP
jgi:hypothetical protein